MARQFQGAAKGRGFNPIPISSANITRMREENERILRGMREQRESERRNEERQLRDMQADAAYYEKARSRDFKVESTNLANEQKQLEYNEAERVAQYNASTKAMSAIFTDVAKFSETAGKLAQKFKEKKEKAEIEEGILWRKTNGSINPAQIEFNEGGGIERIAIEQVSGNLEIAEAEGAPRNEIAKARFLTRHQSIGALQEEARQRALTKYVGYRTNFLRENPEALENSTTTREALNAVTLGFLKEEGLDQYSPELLGKALDEMERFDSTFMSGIIDRETQNINTQTITIVTNQALSDWNNYGANSFNEVRRIKGADEAHTWMKKMATAMDENGKFLLKDNQWQNTDVRGDGIAYYTGERNKGFYARSVEILNAREDKRRKWNTGVATDERQSYQEESRAWLRHIVIDGKNTPEDLAAAAESFKDNVQGKPEWLQNLEAAGDPANAESNTNLITMAKDLEARGMLNQGLVDKIYQYDPVQANTLQESLNKQNPFLQSDQYVDLREITTNLTKTKMPGGGLSTDTATSYIASGKLGKIYDADVQARVANGESIEQASRNSSTFISDQITRDANNPDGTYYREYNAALGVYEYPNLIDADVISIVEKTTTEKTMFAEKINSGDVNDLFKPENKDKVMTDIDFNANVASMLKPGYTYPARVQMVADKTGESPFSIMQRIASSKGMPAIEPPQSMRQLGTYSPKAQALVNKFSYNANARGNGIGMSEIGTGWNSGAVPDNLREFYRTSAERHGVSPAENSAMGEIESAHGKYSVSYNGSSFGVMQINKAVHRDFYAKHGGNPSNEANIDYGTRHYAGLKKRYNGDIIAAAMAYNGGEGHYELWLAGKKPSWVKNPANDREWQHIVKEMTNHGRKFAIAYYKYSGDNSLLQNPILLRK